MRPPLDAGMDVSTFNDWYWLKSELQAFCRSRKLRTDGSKEEIAARVRVFLSGEASPPPPSRSKPVAEKMPPVLTPETVIGAGWKLNAPLRAFFESQIAGKFRFNQALRDLFANPQGRTLGDALTLYRETADTPTQSISRQFQYNRHMRDYFARHPDASREEARKAWMEKRGVAGQIRASDLDDQD